MQISFAEPYHRQCVPPRSNLIISRIRGVTRVSRDLHKIPRAQSEPGERGRVTVRPSREDSRNDGTKVHSVQSKGAGRASQIASWRNFWPGWGKFRSDFWESNRERGTPSIIPWLLTVYPHVRTVARPEAPIEIRRRIESSISRRPMRLLRTSPPTRPCSVLHFTMSLR